MKQFIGTKIVNAKPMTRQEYNDLCGWKLPSDEDGSDKGYLVECIDEGKATPPVFTSGYLSWSPAAAFERAYRAQSKMTFGDALVALKHGNKVARCGWSGKGMFLMLIRDWDMVESETARLVDDLETLPWIGMKTADDKFVPWLCSQTDALAEDWCILDKAP